MRHPPVQSGCSRKPPPSLPVPTKLSASHAVDTIERQRPFRTYLLNSTLHGLRYVGQTTISSAERCFFAVAFALVVLLASYFITNVYAKWRASPLIISLNATATPITEFPFPAVTICNMNQARREVVQTFVPGSNDALLMRSMCGRHNASAVLELATDTSWRYFQQFLRKVSRPCADVLVNCRFGTRPYPCVHLFKTVLTDEGVCCIFNGVHKRFLLHDYRCVEFAVCRIQLTRSMGIRSHTARTMTHSISRWTPLTHHRR